MVFSTVLKTFLISNLTTLDLSITIVVKPFHMEFRIFPFTFVFFLYFVYIAIDKLTVNIQLDLKAVAYLKTLYWNGQQWCDDGL